MDLKPSPSARLKTTRAACSPSTGRTSLATTTCEPSQQTGLLPMELPLMSSAAGSRARTLASLENGLALKVRALVSGESMPVSLASYDHASSSWRTCQACLISGWEPFSETFPRSGMTRRGTAYQLPPLAPLTGEIAFGSWPTPRATDPEKRGNFNPYDPRTGLAGAVKIWPTPRANNGTGPSFGARGGQSLQTEVLFWPTPTAVTDTGGAALCKWGRSGARAKLRKMVTPQELNGSLNPTWVEWLQGFPLGWTEVE